MANYLRMLLGLPLCLLMQSAFSTQLTVESGPQGFFKLDWSSSKHSYLNSDRPVSIAYRKVDEDHWTKIVPTGALIEHSLHPDGVRSPGTGNITLPLGDYVFRLEECEIFQWSHPQGVTTNLLCGNPPPSAWGSPNFPSIQTEMFSAQHHAPAEFTAPTVGPVTLSKDQIRVVPINQYGHLQVDWRGAEITSGFVEIQYRNLNESTWKMFEPGVSGFPAITLSIPFSSSTHIGMPQSGSISTLLSQAGTYVFRMRTCRFESQAQGVPGTKICRAYIATDKITVSALNLANLPPIVSITSPSVNTKFVSGQNITVNVSAIDPEIPGIPNSSSQVAKVDFYRVVTPSQISLDESAIVHTATSPQNGYYQYSFAPTATGEYYIVAVATDTAGAKNYSMTSVVVVARPNNQTSPNNTVPVNFGRYSIYYGDFDNDGNRDIYFHGKPLTIILDADIAIPLTLSAPTGFAYFGQENGSYTVASEWDMTDATVKSCSICRLAQEGTDYLLGDMNNDGNSDILVIGENNESSSILINGAEGTSLPNILLEILNTGHTRKPGQASSITPYFTNNLRGGSLSITEGKIFVGNIGQTLLSLQQLASSEGSYLAANQNISEPALPVMPLPTLNAAEQAEIDTLTSFGGEFRVNETGAATYTIPLELPAGTAGVVPSVTLGYSSQAGIGNMGLGWSMSAGSSISRCRQVLQIDGQAEPIRFKSSDRFCLDGQRLLLVNGAQYGDVGAIYKPEIDNGTIVTSIGGILGHPDKFVVTAKDGSVQVLGGDSNHHSEVFGRTASGSEVFAKNDSDEVQEFYSVMAWNVSEFKDNVGNKIIYEYVSGPKHHRLNSIQYAFGDPANPSSVAAVVVSFAYHDLLKENPYWIAGSKFVDKSRLYKITVTDRGELFREYHIDYGQGVYESGNDGISRVTKIRSCIGEQCSRPISFEWGFASPKAAVLGNGKVNTYDANPLNFSRDGMYTNGYPGGGSANNFPAAINNFLLTSDHGYGEYYSHVDMDIDGDGLQDIVLLEGQMSQVSPSFRLYSFKQLKEGGYERRVDLGHLQGDPHLGGGVEAPHIVPVDFNTDGRMDLAVYIPKLKAWHTYFSLPQNESIWKLIKVENFLPDAVQDTAFPADNLRFVDMNADGLADAVYTKNNVLYVHYLKRKQASGNLTEEQISQSSQAYAFNEIADITADAQGLDIYNFAGVLDLNEDGKADLVATKVDLNKNVVPFVTPFETGEHVTCNYNVSLQVLLSNTDNTFQASALTAVAQGSYTALEIGDEKIIAKCDLHNFRRRMFGPYLVDINADGLTDLVWAFGNHRYVRWNDPNRDPEYFTTQVSYKLGREDLSFGPQVNVSLGYDAMGFELMDIDSDGDQDLLLTGIGDRRLIKWNINNFGSATILEGTADARFSDINGDGYLDKSVIKDSRLTVTHGVPKQNNLIIKIESGLDVSTNIYYEPLRDSGRYRKLEGILTVQDGEIIDTYCIPVSVEQGGGCFPKPPRPRYVADANEFYRQINDPFSDSELGLRVDEKTPVLEMIGMSPVVTRVSSSAPSLDNTNALVGVEYSYEEQKIQAGGRGFLGFKKLITTDMQTGIVTETEYRQDWPFIGMPIKTTTKTRFGNVLNESTNRMAIVGINENNIEEKRLLAKQGTAQLGPLVIYIKETTDTTFDVPDVKLAMPVGNAQMDNTQYQKLSEVITTTDQDAQGNVTSLIISTRNGAGVELQKQTTTNEYFPGTGLPPHSETQDGERYGRLKRSEVTTERPGLGSQTRVAEFTYYGYPGASCVGAHLRGVLCSEKVIASNLAGSDSPEMVQHFYDKFGNKIATKSGGRVSSLTEYDSRGRYVQTTYDVFRQETGIGSASSVYPTSLPAGAVAVKTSEVILRDKFGNALLQKTVLGNNQWLYQTQASTPMGAIYFRGDSTGAFEETRMQRTFLTAANWCPSGTVYLVTSTKAGGAKATQCFNKVGQNTGGYTVGFSGEIIRVRKDYDVLGRIVRAYEPSKNATPTLFTATEYDVLNRPTKVTHPFNTTSTTGIESNIAATTTFSYVGLKTIATVAGYSDPQNNTARTKEELRNALGELISVTEMGNRSIHYKYDVAGSLTETIDPAGNKVIIVYNSLGQKVSMTDPDKGVWQYQYNAFGEMTSQVDANGTITTIAYDFKGRKISQTVVNPTSSNGYVQNWEYDLAENGLGQVFRETKNAFPSGVREFTRNTSFDSLGRSSISTVTFKGIGVTEESHYQKVVYDQYGRVYQTFDAARAGPQFNYNGVQNVYNQYGYLTEVQDAAEGGGAPFYTVKAMDARGNVVEMDYGNGDKVTYLYDGKTGSLKEIKRQFANDQASIKHYSAKWDHFGNLVERDPEFLGGAAETFRYDNYNRLVSNTLNNHTVSIAYNDIDNIIQKSDVEGNATYHYDAIKKHAVTKIGNREYEYDANGNLVKEFTGTTLKKKFTYTPNDLVSKIELFGDNAHTSEFFYDTNNARYKRIDRDHQGKTTTTLYLGGVEKIYNADGSVQWKRQIGAVAQVTHEVTPSSIGINGTRHYFHKDHLGSTNAITDSVGAIVQRMAFDPWGARRAINNGAWQASSMQQDSILASYAKTAKPITTRGYTSHEMLDEVGIIHMNGRIYDASIGRFLQADPFVDGVTSIAGYNRYSYVHNNPLNATDPTGYLKLLRKGIKSLTKIFGAEVVNLFGTMLFRYLGGPVGMAIWNYEFARANGLSAADAFKNAVIADIANSAFSFIGARDWKLPAKALGHGVVGGLSSIAHGGKFGHGFVSAGLTKMFDVNDMYGMKYGFGHTVARVGMAYMIGGTISEATGGKFANGGRTAAMGQLFNGESKVKGEAEQAAQEASGPAGADTEADRVAFQKELDALTTDGSLSKYRSFDNADAAATEVLDLTAPLSKKYGLEVGGNIWQDKKGWHYTIPIIGGPGSVGVPGSHIGYHTHPYGSMKFSNQFNSYTGGPGDAGWVASSGKSLYMGVVINGSVSIGVCDPGSCAQSGRLGTSPSRVLK